MRSIHVYLENGFDHDRVTVVAGGDEHEEQNVTTRYQVGLASIVELQVPDGSATDVRIALPARGLEVDVPVDPVATPHIRVNATDGVLTARTEAAPPRFA